MCEWVRNVVKTTPLREVFRLFRPRGITQNRRSWDPSPRQGSEHGPQHISEPGPRARAAAIGIALALALPAAPAWAVWPFDRPEENVGVGQATAGLLSRMIQIPTVNPPGNEEKLARLLVDELKAKGVEAQLVPTPAASSPGAQGRAAVWARVRGTGQQRPLILLSHLDVVPADESQWKRDPFSGDISGGWVYGRGALDAKGVTAVQVMALVEIARRGVPLERDIILLATPDEETGGRNGVDYLLREQSHLLQDAEFLLTEGGSIRPKQAGLDGEDPIPSIWGITVTEKSPCWIELRTRGTAGHGSAPRQDAAVPRLLAALDRVRRVESPIRVLPEVESMFLALAASAPVEDRAGFVSLSRALEEDSAFRRRFLAQPSYNALVRNTLSITVLEGGSRTNVVPSSARAEIDARLLPGERCEDFLAALEEVIADPQVETRILLSFPSRSSPENTALFEAIERVARQRDPDAVVVPRMIGGFTDAHYFRERNIVAYGFVPRWLSAADTQGIHGVDERISIENLGTGVETLVEIIDELSRPRVPEKEEEPLSQLLYGPVERFEERFNVLDFQA